MTPSELQAIAERYERSCTATSHTDLVAPLADIPRLLEAVKELTERVAERDTYIQEVARAKLTAFDDDRRLRAQLVVMTARCERLEKAIELPGLEDLVGEFAADEIRRKLNAALRDEPTGGAK